MCHNFILLIAPNGPPTNFIVTADTSTQLTLSWKPPVVEERNGIIIRYYYNCSSDNITTAIESTTGLTAVVRGLKPFTNYTCSVRPATVAGNGTMTASNTMTTAEDGEYSLLVVIVTHYSSLISLAPSLVKNLASVGQSASVFYIFWNEPETPNGIISHYIVSILNYSDDSMIIEENASVNYSTINSGLLGKYM